MKYLKKISEELKSSVYKSAADKLARMGHKKRVADLEDWFRIKEKREKEEEIREEIKKVENIGTFNITIGDNDDYIGDFYIKMCFEPTNFRTNYDDWMREGYSLYLSINLYIIPVNDDFKDTKIAKNIPLHKGSQDFLYLIGEIYIDLGNYPEDQLDKIDDNYRLYKMDEYSPNLPHPENPKGIIFHEYFDYPFRFTDRKNAAKFRKTLIDIFKGNIIHDESNENPGGLKEEIMDYIISEFDILTISEFEDFIKSLGRININTLFKD